MFRPSMPEIRRNIRNLTATGAALGMVATGCTAFGGQGGTTECPAPTAQALAAAKSLEAQPQDTYLYQAEQDVAKDKTIKAADREEVIQWRTRQHDATESHVIVRNPLDFILPLEEDLAKGAHALFSEYLSKAQGYLKLFGVTLQLAGTPGAPELQDNMQVPTMSDFENRTAKQNVVNLMDALAGMPQQYVDLVGLKHVYLAAGTHTTKIGRGLRVAAYASAAGVVLDFDFVEDASMPEHELLHRLDSRLCGGDAAMGNDPAFAQFNNGRAYSLNNYSPTLESFWSDPTTRTEVNEENALNPKTQHAAWAAMNATINARLNQVWYVTPYSEMENVREDKAETGKVLTSGDWAQVVGSAVPAAIRGKFTTIYARLIEASPDLGNYFAVSSVKING